jgi:hypothetical protein
MDNVTGNTGALFLFIGTIIITISVVLSLVLGFLGFGAAGEIAAKAIVDAGGSSAEAETARSIANITFIVILVLSALIELLVIIPGFKYSLQRKCRTWAFVMAIILIISVVVNLIQNIANPAGLASVLVGAVGGILYIIGVLMLRKKEA